LILQIKYFGGRGEILLSVKIFDRKTAKAGQLGECPLMLQRIIIFDHLSISACRSGKILTTIDLAQIPLPLCMSPAALS
jgi:hypothetical protein